MQEFTTDIHTVVKRVETSPEFEAFNKENPHHYLVHAFSTVDISTAINSHIELGYYGKEEDKITVFKTAPIMAMPPEEVFKQGGVLEPLDLTAVRIGLSGALERAEKERQANYPKHATMKFICVLQQQEQAAWNMTLVTGTLHMINIKIDATTGFTISRTISSIMDLAKE